MCVWTRERDSRTRPIPVAIKRFVTVCVAEHGSISYLESPMPPNAKALAAPLGACEGGLASAHTPPTKPNCVRLTSIGSRSPKFARNFAALRELWS